MKNFKFLSALALTGMLSTSIIGTSLAATDAKTTPCGVFDDLVAGTEKVVPFVLANRNDIVTMKDVKDSGKFINVSSNVSDTEAIGTGDTFTADAKTHTVVVYGDVNKDGKVNILDALAIEDSRNGGPALDALQSETANVVRADGSKVNIIDALHIEQYRNNETEIIIDQTPDEEQKQQGNIIITPKDKYVNTQNQSKFPITLNIKEQLQKEIKANFYRVDDEGKTVNQKLGNTITIPAGTSFLDKEINLNSYVPQGTSVIRLLSDPDGELLAEFTVEKHTTEVNAAQIIGIRTFRPGENTGTVSFQVIPGESKITKAYYVTREYQDASAGTSGNTTINKSSFDFTKEVPYLTVENNKVEDAEISVEKGKAYDVFFVLEDEYGSISSQLCNKASSSSDAKVAKAIIPIDPESGATSNAKTIISALMPDFKTNTALSAAKVTWTYEASASISSSDKYVVILYKDDEPIAQKELTSLSSAEFELSQFGISSLGKGTYKVGIIAKGDSKTFDAPEFITTNSQTVVELNPVENINYEVDENNDAYLSWDSEYNELSADVANFNVNLGAYSSGKYTSFATNAGSTIEKRQKLSSMATATLYKAQVTVKRANPNLAEIDSVPTVSEKEFFKVETPTVSSRKENEVTFKIGTPSSKVNVSGLDTTYAVELYTKNEDSSYTQVGNVQEIGKIDTTTGEFKVTGLQVGQKYAIRLVATVKGVDGNVTSKTGYIPVDSTLADAVSIVNKTKVTLSTSKTRAGKDEIGVLTTSDGISVDGIAYKTTDYPEVTKVINILNAIKDTDVITYSTGELTIKIPDDAKTETRALAATVENMNVNITGGRHPQTITTTEANKPTKVTLTGGEGTFTVNDLYAGELVVNGGTKIETATPDTNGKEITIPNGTVTYNSTLKATTTEETKLKLKTPASAVSEVEITANGSTSDAITLDTTNATYGMTVTYKTGLNEQNKAIKTQGGQLTINATKGNITVVATDMDSVTSSISATTTDGNVDIDDAKLKSGKQEVTITNSDTTEHTVNAYLSDVPYTISTAIDIKEYKENEIDSIKSKVSNVELTSKNLADFNNFLKSFGLTYNEAVSEDSKAIGGATIKTNADNGTVEIKFNNKTTGKTDVNPRAVTITGLRS